jgi:hypothetical protein
MICCWCSGRHGGCVRGIVDSFLTSTIVSTRLGQLRDSASQYAGINLLRDGSAPEKPTIVKPHFAVLMRYSMLGPTFFGAIERISFPEDRHGRAVDDA